MRGARSAQSLDRAESGNRRLQDPAEAAVAAEGTGTFGRVGIVTIGNLDWVNEIDVVVDERESLQRPIRGRLAK